MAHRRLHEITVGDGRTVEITCADAENEIAELERQLAEARKAAAWVPIDEQHLPKQDARFTVQVLIYRPGDQLDAIELWPVCLRHISDVLARGFTLFKAINPPQPKEKP